jgi:hypothetical protein
MKWNNQSISPVADFPVEKKFELPSEDKSYAERAELPLDNPEHPLNEEPWAPRIPTDYIRHKMSGEEPSKKKMQTLEEMKAMIAAIPAHRPVTTNYTKPTVVEDQPSYDELNTVDYGEV